MNQLNMKSFLERRERELDRKEAHQISDQYLIEKKSAEKSAREVKSSKLAAWISAWATVVALIVAIIALTKSL